MGKLDGKVAIVTGAASGIGRAAAHAFAGEGAAVLCVDVHEGEAKQTADDIEGAGGRAASFRADVAQPDEVREMVRTAVSEFGALDVIFNNAGIEGEQAPTAECTLENFDRVIAVNLKGVFLGMKYAIPAMLERGGGSIINCSSVAGTVGFPGVPAYCASKGGVVQLTKAAALEYAQQGIRVNAICPGVIWTPMVERFTGGAEEAEQAMIGLEPVGRMGTPEEVASVAVFLAADDSSFCTGSNVMVDGGFTAA